jgi:Ca2+-binding RTX toxin-like protein
MSRIALATALAVIGLVPGVAGAATVHVQDGGIILAASAGEDNFLLVFPTPGDSGRITFQQPVGNAPLTAGFGCTQVDSRNVSCPIGNGNVTADLGDIGDRFETDVEGIRVTVTGGDGNDGIVTTKAGPSTLDGGPGSDQLHAGTASDTLRGGAGTDILRADVVRTQDGTLVVSDSIGGDDLLQGGADADDYSGGPGGGDVVSYADATTAVTAALALRPGRGLSTFGSGPGGEAIPEDIEGLTGGPGNDTLTGNELGNQIRGEGGADILTGNERSDNISGGSGGDDIRTRDGHTDLISCGANGTGGRSTSGGGDRLDSDLADGRPPSDCEFVTQGALREGKNVRMASGALTATGDGRVPVRLRCPAEVAIGCRGTLGLALLPRGRRRALPAAASRRYRLAAGRSTVVTLRLSRRELAALRRGRRLARLRSVEAGEFGAKTTIGTVSLRARRSRG